MKNPIGGLVHVTGDHDTGKTLFALTCGAEPSRIAFFDSDVKGRATVNQIGAKNFGLYHDLVAEGDKMREVEFHEHCLGLIAGLKPKQFDVIVWDTWTPLAKTCHAYVVKNPGKFRESWSPMGLIKGAEMWGESFNYEGELLNRLLQLAPLVIVTTHLKAHRVQVTEQKSVLTGKQIPDCSKAVVEKSNFRVWLRHNPSGSPAPVGLVLKRLAKYTVGKSGGLEAVNVLPRRLSPCTWAKVIEYWNNPMGDRAAEEGETPNEFELSILDGTLTADQKDVLSAGLKGLETEEVEIPEVDELTTRAKELKAGGMGLPAIARELGITVPDVAKRVK